MMHVGRNDPCPCGSGKKHKKCCLNKVVSLDQIIGSELERLQMELFLFAEEEASINKISTFESGAEEEDEEVFSVLMEMFHTLLRPVHPGGKIVVDTFIEKKEKKLRPSVLKELKKWQGTEPTFSIIKKIIDDHWIEVEDFATGEMKQVKLDDESPELEQEGLLYGFLLPHGTYYSYYVFFLDVTADEAEEFLDVFSAAFKTSEYTEWQPFITNEFENITKLLMFGEDNFGIGEGVMENSLHQLVLDFYKEKMNSFLYTADMVETGEYLWKIFCAKVNPNFRKPQIYAGALHYFVDMHIAGFRSFTQKEMAEQYNSSVTALSRAYNELINVFEGEMSDMFEEAGPLESTLPDELEDDNPPSFNRMTMEREMMEMTKLLEEQDFDSIDDANAFLNEMMNQPTHRKEREMSVEEQAIDLVYDAYEAVGRKRVQLAEQALKLDPGCVDAFNILGEETRNHKKAAAYFKQAMDAGEKKLGKPFFSENEGYFWGIMETRPYMRAKYNYAQVLAFAGKMNSAIRQYEEMLELNESDNQGVRDELFGAYVESRQYKEARQLLEKYPDDFTARGVFNSLLMEYLLNGISVKLKTLFTHAQNTNPHVLDYLLSKKLLPKELPNAYRPGGEAEAEIYVFETKHLWEKEKALLEWMHKHK